MRSCTPQKQPPARMAFSVLPLIVMHSRCRRCPPQLAPHTAQKYSNAYGPKGIPPACARRLTCGDAPWWTWRGSTYSPSGGGVDELLVHELVDAQRPQFTPGP